MIRDIEIRTEQMFGRVDDIKIKELDSSRFSITGRGLVVPNKDGGDHQGAKKSWGKIGVDLGFQKESKIGEFIPDK